MFRIPTPTRLVLKFQFLTLFIFLMVLIFEYHYIYSSSCQVPTNRGSSSIHLRGLKDSGVNDSIIMKSISKNLPNLPLTYRESVGKRSMYFNSSCAPLPKLFDIKFNNNNWQTLTTSNGTFQLLNAYYDNRTDNPIKPIIRILGMLDRIEPTVKTYCQLWFDNTKKPTIVKVYEYKYLWNKFWGNYKTGIYQAYILACQIPINISAVPKAVSLVENPCDLSTVSLKIIYNKPEKTKDFAVCVKGLNYPYTDRSVRLIEWMELLYILGADKIFFYNLDAHPNILKILNYYETEDKAEVTPLTLAGDQPNSHPLQFYYLKKKITFKRQNEVISYNDCFYRHMYEYKYIILLDIDEVIVPVMYYTWRELMDMEEKKAKARKIAEYSSYNVQNVYFLDDLLHNHGWFDDIPKHMHMLQHVFRSKNFTKPGAYIKSFLNTNKIVGLHNHFPFYCIGKCINHAVDKNYAQLQHYRSDCVQDLKKYCGNYRNNSIQDTTIWKYKEVLIKNVKNTLDQIRFVIEENLT